MDAAHDRELIAQVKSSLRSLYLLIQEAFDSLFFPIHSQRALDRLVVV
jgi:hypothetical protein